MEELLERYPVLRACEREIAEALELLTETYRKGGKVLVCGNGGSCSDAEHIVGELMKSFRLPRPVTDERIPAHLRGRLQGALPAISLPSQTAILSAFGNDVDPETSYAQLVYGYAREGDAVIGLSTSGNSKNVVAAIETAKALGARTLALTGKKESRLSAIADVTIRVPETETYRVQELHLPIYHCLCAKLEETFFG